MKFNDFKYSRPDMEAMEIAFKNLLDAFDEAEDVSTQNDILKRINGLRANYDTMENIAMIRYTINTADPANEAEQNFFDQSNPLFGKLVNDFYRSLVNSKFKTELKEQWGEHLFNLAEVKLLTFEPSIIEDLQKENQLNSEYTKLMATAKIMFEGAERNLSDMSPFESSADRDMRRRASAAKWQFFADNTEQIDRIFDEQVKLRHKMAVQLGFKNFVELGYKRMMRTDYNAEMVANYRKQVLEVIVPMAAKLRKRQAKRLDISDFKSYDLSLSFKTGNPTPKGNPDWIVAHGKKMYEELCTETNEFINYMLDNELIDLVSKKGKAPGGYCTYIENYRSPFIFSNFNGTSHDINVLTHEAGHAFQVYMSRDFEMPEYLWPTYEACEIHSMSMEFLAWPWMDQFFKGDVDKFKFEHLNDAILFLPYGVSVDEFQHFVYENPEATPAERKQAWRNIEKKYMPWIDYDGNEFLENGGFWQKQSHIFGSPFYYIDYTLAQICAFQFWKKSNENRSNALHDYIQLCKKGGSAPFLKLVESANLQSPFEDGCLKEVVAPVSAYLEEVNDMVL